MHESSLRYGGLRIKAWVAAGRDWPGAGGVQGRGDPWEGRRDGTLALLASVAPRADRPCRFGTIGARTSAESWSGVRR